MLRQQAYKFELRPTGEQTRKLRQFAGSCRFVYNRALSLQQENYQAGAKYIGYVAMANRLPGWRKHEDTAWLKDAPAHPLQQALRDLDRAYQNFFARRAAYPRFKKKGAGDSFRYPEPKQFKLDQANDRVFLPKLGWLRYRNSRQVLGELRNITISERSGKWFFSIQTSREVAQPTHASTSMVGIDMGITVFAAQSDGVDHLPLNSFKQSQRKLARAQRSLARKCKFSSNWKKQKATIGRIHRHVANARADYLHKTSHHICKNHAVVCIEDLKIASLSRSASGNAQTPGKNVKAKSGLNRSIVDQGWGEFRRQLEYKLNWEGGQLIVVPAHYTSQQCSACGHVEKANRKTQAEFCCLSCGHTQNADMNAAKNIEAAGHAVLACGGDVRPELRMIAAQAAPVKQEPTEAIQAIA